MPTHEELRQQSDALVAVADAMQATNPWTREEWEAISEIRHAAADLFSAAGWLAKLEGAL
jgi:hypothetical protein